MDIYFCPLLKLQCGTAKTLPTHRNADTAVCRKSERLVKTSVLY